MGHTSFGYRIENGKAVIDEAAAEQIRILFHSYLSGDSLTTAAQKAGINSFHAGIGKMLRNTRYLGDEYYPAIIDPVTFAAAEAERIKRAEKLGRIREPKEETEVVFPTTFYIKEATQQFDDPFQQAEYAYSLIESEVQEDGNKKDYHLASKTITLLPARKHAAKANKDEEKPKLRVAAYCRVSTDSDEQATSYEAQIEHYTAYINGHPDWELAGIYADDGISGTNTKKREEFNRMIDECMAGTIDMVITKSISRFARNTLDCLKYIRQLKEKNIPVYFEKENINSMDSKGEVMLTIMASLAQQESQSLSQNVKLGLQYRYQQGEIQVNCNRFLGYTKDENKHLVIVPEEAEIVKRIYREYLEGASMLKIARGLEADGILNGAGREKWHTSNINQILRNEKYIGDALLQKTYTVDFLTKKRVKNNGIVPQYYVENSHEAIIPREIFMQVQEELIRRRIVHTSPNGKNRTFSSTHCFSNMIIRGGCGEFFRRIHWNNRGKKSVVWRCISRLENTGQFCDARTVLESTIERVLVTAINQTLCDKDSFLATLQNNIETVIIHENDQTLANISKRLEELQTELLKLANAKADYEDVANEIYRLREEKQNTLLQCANRDELLKRIDDMSTFLREQPTALIEYEEALVRRLIEKVTVYEDKFTVEFKSGVNVEINE